MSRSQQPKAAFDVRGIVEGFYGPPWSHQQRLDLMEFFGECRFNLYIYAPKDDPFHRERWRDPYPLSQLEKLKELVEAAHKNNVDFCFAISPGLSIRYSDEKEFMKLTEKIEAVRELGVRWFGLFLDDVPVDLKHDEDKEAFESLADAQADLANRLLRFLRERDPRIQLIFCPTEYIGTSTSPYLETIGTKIQPEVYIMWTGRAVLSPEITPADADAFGKALKRKPFVWDNYPVNDYDRMRLNLGPIRNRDKNLGDHISGYVSNPMNEAEASKIPLATIADYLLNPQDYAPEKSWDAAIRRVAGEEAYGALRKFAEHSQTSFLWTAESARLKEQIDEFWNSWETESWGESAEDLRKAFRVLTVLRETLNSTLANRQLLEEITPYFPKISLVGAMGILSLDLLIRKRAAEEDQEIETLTKELHELRRKYEGDDHEVSAAYILEFMASALAGRRTVPGTREEVQNFLNDRSMCTFTTVGRDGPRASPAGYHAVGLDVYVLAPADSEIALNIVEYPVVVLTVFDTPNTPVLTWTRERRGIEYLGTARILNEDEAASAPEPVSSFHKSMSKQAPGEFSLIKVSPTRIYLIRRVPGALMYGSTQLESREVLEIG